MNFEEQNEFAKKILQIVKNYGEHKNESLLNHDIHTMSQDYVTLEMYEELEWKLHELKIISENMYFIFKK